MRTAENCKALLSMKLLIDFCADDAALLTQGEEDKAKGRKRAAERLFRLESSQPKDREGEENAAVLVMV